MVAAVLKASPERIVLTHGAAEAARLVALEVLEPRARRPARACCSTVLDRAVAAAVRDVADVAGAEVEVLTEAAAHLRGRRGPGGHGARRCGWPSGRRRRRSPSRCTRPVRACSWTPAAAPAPCRLDVDELGADFVIADSHRWLLGPDARGVAVDHARPRRGAARVVARRPRRRSRRGSATGAGAQRRLVADVRGAAVGASIARWRWPISSTTTSPPSRAWSWWLRPSAHGAVAAFRIARLGRRGSGRGARSQHLRHRRGRRRGRPHPRQRRRLEPRERARALRRACRGACRAHARDPAPPAQPDGHQRTDSSPEEDA